jgi:hypothetical protein
VLRNSHYFNIKPGVDAERIISIIDNEIAAHAKTFGCIERKTWKLLDFHNWNEEVPLAPPPATYLNESLWPSQKEADAFGQSEDSGEIKALMEELFNGAEFVLSVRYVDDEV